MPNDIVTSVDAMMRAMGCEKSSNAFYAEAFESIREQYKLDDNLALATSVVQTLLSRYTTTIPDTFSTHMSDLLESNLFKSLVAHHQNNRDFVSIVIQVCGAKLEAFPALAQDKSLALIAIETNYEILEDVIGQFSKPEDRIELAKLAMHMGGEAEYTTRRFMHC